ncbi:MAG: cytochrome C oxidase subunit I [Rickettsiales bacterium]|nr:cytochrome C oxidase subunit I [Rickettsiales bacterium]
MQKTQTELYNYNLHRVLPARSQWPLRWLLLGVLALALSGLPAIILVIARTIAPETGAMFINAFDVALAIHVDLSVLVWFIAILGMVWSLFLDNALAAHAPFVRGTAWWVALLACFCMAAAAFAPVEEVHFSNYVPVIVSPTFFLGLGLFSSAVIIIAGYVLLLPLFGLKPLKGMTSPEGVLGYAVYSAAFIVVVALAVFALTAEYLPASLQGHTYYEYLFWGGGHVLQFAYTQLLLIAWLSLLCGVTKSVRIKPVWVLAILSVGPITAVTSFYPFIAMDVMDEWFRRFFTWQMAIAGGIAAIVFAVLMLWQLCTRGKADVTKRALWSSLIMSLLVFGAGGLFGAVIDGVNVTIPAHYHGVIVGVTLAAMGLAYQLLPRFGCLTVAHTRMAFWQPIVYGVGQLLHIGGLAIGGGYGVMRKTPGIVQEGGIWVDVAMHMIRWGGLLAVIGGLLFIIVILRSLRHKRAH